MVAGGFRGGGVEEDEASVLVSVPRCARRTVRFQMAAAAFFFVRLAFRVLLIFPMTLEYPWIRKNVLSNMKGFLRCLFGSGSDRTKTQIFGFVFPLIKFISLLYPNFSYNGS